MLNFLYIPVSWVLLRWHQLLTFLGMGADSGLTWALSIILLVVTARLLLFRVFIKQVHYQRHMQEMQPKLTAIREKYKNDKAEQQRQMMALQQEQGFNPLSGCLPMFLQAPIFIALFHVLRHLSNSQSLCHPIQTANDHLSLYTFTPAETCSAATSKLFGAPLAGSLRDAAHTITSLGGDVNHTRIVTIVLVIISAGATFMTQLLVSARATTVPVGTAATVQRLMKVFIPISVIFSGVFFPLGVLLYWFTSNTWTLLQQVYINRFHPHTPSTTVAAGTVGKAYAPKPGARPSRDARRGSAGTTVDLGKAPAAAPAEADVAPARSTPPRPGQRPARPAGSRPGGKRPTQAKKRR